MLFHGPHVQLGAQGLTGRRPFLSLSARDGLTVAHWHICTSGLYAVRQ